MIDPLEASQVKTRRFFQIFILIMGLLLTALGLSAQEPAKSASACARAHIKESVIVAGFNFKTYSDELSVETCVQVLAGGKVIFRRTNDNGGQFSLGQPASKKDHIPAIANGADITGRGHPDMIVSWNTGGAHCCLTNYVFELEPPFRLLATIDAEDDELSHFMDMDGDGRYFYVSTDWTFAYWPMSFAGSPSAPIILRFVQEGDRGSYHLALDKMRQPAPTSSEWKELVGKSKGTFDDMPLEFNGTFWEIEMRLIYSGRSEWAWKLLNETWPVKAPGKQKWLGDFCARFKTSPWWPDLQPTVQNMPQACANAKPRPD